jgi:hypothetical protein
LVDNNCFHISSRCTVRKQLLTKLRWAKPELVTDATDSQKIQTGSGWGRRGEVA